MLTIVPTPLGNLEDITLRSLTALREADIILCEDTRRTVKLLSRHAISKKLLRYNERSVRSVNEALNLLSLGKKIALVSDGGMPCISDPGRTLVALAGERGLGVQILPGPSAVITAAAGSGLPADSFVFLGFLPRSKGKTVKTLKRAFALEKTVILYESPFRIKKFMELVISEFGPETETVVARELTKVYEEWLKGTALETLKKLEAVKEVKGEITVLLRASPGHAESKINKNFCRKNFCDSPP